MENLAERKERIWYWDTVKFFMILCVVMGHFVESMASFGRTDIVPLKIFIYSFHMPMFIFIFGIFYKEKNSRKKALFFLLAGYLFKFFIFFVSRLINGDAMFTLFYDAGATWFFFSLVWYILLAKALKRFDKRLVLVISFTISLFSGYFKEINEFLSISRTIVFFPYFWLGTMIDKRSLLAGIRKIRKYLLIPSIVLLTGWLLICFLGYDDLKVIIPLLSGRNPFTEKTEGMGCLYRLLTTAITVLTGAAILIVVPEKKIPVISYMGRNTINVYFWHYTFLYMVFRFLNVQKIVANDWGVILFLVIAAAITFLLSLDIFNFPLKYLNRLIMNPSKVNDRSS